MNKILIFISLFTFSFSSFSGNSIFGKWKDKSEPSSYKYEFKKNNDFIYGSYWKEKGKIKSSIKKGVWEIGDWDATQSNGKKTSCDIMIYADTSECCFSFKFIANNLILTNKYNSNSVNGIGFGSMCENRVLIKDK